MIHSSSGKVSRAKLLRLIAGFTILLLLLFYVDGSVLVSHLTHLRGDYLFYAAASITVATLIGSVIAYLVVAMDTAVSYARFVGFYWFSWALSLVIPGQIGDIASLTILMKRAGLEWPRILSRAVLDKAISFTVMSLMAMLALIRYSDYLKVETSALALTLPVLLVLVILAWYAVKRLATGPADRFDWLVPVLTNLRDTTEFVKRKPMLIAVNVLGTALKIVLVGTAYWFIFLAGGAPSPDWAGVVLLATVSSLVAYVPISFNGLGTVEVTGILLFSMLGMSEELVLASYLVLRVTVLTIAWTPSLFIYLFSGKSANQSLG